MRSLHETGSLPRPNQTAVCFGLGQPPVENHLFARPTNETISLSFQTSSPPAQGRWGVTHETPATCGEKRVQSGAVQLGK